jgi:hypothetical protein
MVVYVTDMAGDMVRVTRRQGDWVVTEELYEQNEEIFKWRDVKVGDVLRYYECFNGRTNRSDYLHRMDLVKEGDEIIYFDRKTTSKFRGKVSTLLYEDRAVDLGGSEPLISAYNIVRSVEPQEDEIFTSVSIEFIDGILLNFYNQLALLSIYEEQKLIYCIFGRAVSSGIDLLRSIQLNNISQIRTTLKDNNITMEQVVAFDAEIAKSIVRKTTYYPDYIKPDSFYDTIVQDCFEKLGINTAKNTYLLDVLERPNTPSIAINRSYEASERSYIISWVGIEIWLGNLKFDKNNKIHTFDLWKKHKHDRKKIKMPISFLYDLVHAVEKHNIDTNYVVYPDTNASIGYSYFNQLQKLLNGSI